MVNYFLSKAWNDHLAQNLKIGDKVKGKDTPGKYKGKITKIEGDAVNIQSKKLGNIDVSKNSITSHKIPSNAMSKFDGAKIQEIYKKKNFKEDSGGYGSQAYQDAMAGK